MYDMVGVRVTEVEKGGKLDELRKFKEGFGGDLMSGYLWKIDINPARCRVFDTLLKVKMRGKSLGPDIVDEETLKRA